MKNLGTCDALYRSLHKQSVFDRWVSCTDDLKYMCFWLIPCICIAGDSSYYTNVNVYYQLHNNLENDNDDELITDWDNLFWASNVLLANITDSGAFHQASQSFLQKWVCGSGGTVR